MKVIWSDPALQELEHIREYIAHDNPMNAEKFVVELLDYVSLRVSDFPLSGRKILEINDPIYRELIFGSYRAMYSFKEEVVTILSVRSSRQRFRLLISK